MARLRYFLILSVVVLSGCLNMDDEDNSMSFLDLGVLNHYGSDYMIITDGGIVLLTKSIPEQIDFDENARVNVKYRILNDAPANDSINIDYWVDVEEIQELITKNILTVDDSNRDFLGNSPVEFQQVWITQDFLTVYFTFYAGTKDHEFNLTYDVNEQADDEFVYLTFRHNDNNDEPARQYWAYVTFRLNSLREEGKSEIKILFRGKQKDGDDYVQSNLVYRY